MSDTDKQILGKQRELSPEEIAEIDAEAEKATERFRKIIQDWSNENKNSCSGTIPKSTNHIISDEEIDNIEQV